MEEPYRKLSDTITKVLSKRWESERGENSRAKSNGKLGALPPLSVAVSKTTAKLRKRN